MVAGTYTSEYEAGGKNIVLKFFRMQVLDRYRQDPRYRIDNGPVSTYLCIKDEFFVAAATSDSDKICIQSIGYGVRKRDNSKVVVAILPDLAGLSPEHQSYWVAFEETEECIADADFIRQDFGAEFTDRVNIFDAFLQEITEINKLCKTIGWPRLFRSEYNEGNRPVYLAPITKPARKQYYELVHVLDKLISENIERIFFTGSIPLEKKVTQQDGTIAIKPKGTLLLLEEWTKRRFRPVDSKPRDDMFATFRKIREERQVPAHTLDEDEYDPQYFTKYKKLIIDAYTAIRTLRLMLMNHPIAKQNYAPPDWLQRGRIDIP